MQEIELLEYWKIIRRRWLLVVLIPVIAVIVSAILSFFVIKPSYQADTTLLVNQTPTQTQGLQYDAIMVSQALVNTYSAIIKSESLESSVIHQLNLAYTPAQLDSMFSVTSPTPSQVIDVKVIETNQSETVHN